jgi:hypothetical protein
LRAVDQLRRRVGAGLHPLVNAGSEDTCTCFVFTACSSISRPVVRWAQARFSLSGGGQGGRKWV